MKEALPLPVLRVDDLRVEFDLGERVVHAVRGLSYAIARGEAVGLVGESGCGKSVSALAVLGLLPDRLARVAGGRLAFMDQDLLSLGAADLNRIRGAGIAMIFQDPLSSLNPVLTVGRQITEAIQAHKDMGATDARRRAIELLDLVGIPAPDKRYSDYPHQFSGGMRQRVMIAMALSCDPLLLIADEPTTALDVTIQAQILELLRHIRMDLGMSMLLITHDLGVVAGMTDRVAVMYAGQIVESGPTEQVLLDPRHPYTVGLLRSVPRIDQPALTALHPIRGAPPDLSSVITGCPFAPRCDWVVDRCRTAAPPFSPFPATDSTRAVACYRADDVRLDAAPARRAQ